MTTPKSKLKRTITASKMKAKSTMTTPKSKSEIKWRRKAVDAGDWKAGARQYRCSLQTMFAIMKDIEIKEPHRLVMARTPFYHMFKALLDDKIIKSKKIEASLDCIIKRYSPGKDAFKFGRSYVKLHKSDVKLIFGIRDGSEKIEFRRKVADTSDFTKRLFPGKNQISHQMIKNLLPDVCKLEDKRSVEDTVRLLCLLLVGTCFFPTTGTKIASGYFKFIDDIDKMKLYDWSDEIISVLKNSLETNYQKPRTVTGCTLLLLYWFSEHFKGFEPENNNFPRCARWDLKEVAGMITFGELDNIRRSEFITEELQATIREVRDLGILIEADENIVNDVTECHMGSQPDSIVNQESHGGRETLAVEAQPEEEIRVHQLEYEGYHYLNDEPQPTEAEEEDTDFEKLENKVVRLNSELSNSKIQVADLAARLADANNQIAVLMKSSARSADVGESKLREKMVEKLIAELASAKNQVADLTTQLEKMVDSRPDIEFVSQEQPEVNLQLQIQRLQRENQKLVQRNEELVATSKDLEESRQTLSAYAEKMTAEVFGIQKTYLEMQKHTERFDMLKTVHMHLNQVNKLQSENSALFKTNNEQRKEMQSMLQEKDSQLQSSAMKIRELTENINQLEEQVVIDVVNSIRQQTRPAMVHGIIEEEQTLLDAVDKITQEGKIVEKRKQIQDIDIEKEGKKEEVPHGNEVTRTESPPSKIKRIREGTESDTFTDGKNSKKQRVDGGEEGYEVIEHKLKDKFENMLTSV